MSQEIEKKVIDYYDDKLNRFGTTARGVDWNSEESQVLRFEQLSKVLPADRNESFSVLDYGCGYGAMYKFLIERYPKIKFSGFDISEKMIATSRSSFPRATWIDKENELKSVDFVIASGIFSVKMEFGDKEWYEYILKTLHSIDKLATKGFSFNALTSYSDAEFMRSNLFYLDPRVIFDYCKRNFSKQVAILHDYPLYEFCVIVRK